MVNEIKQFPKKINNRSEGVDEEEFISILKLIVPGTNLRAALNGAQKVGKGALIVIENDDIFDLIDGGFRINTKFTPQKLIELAKMDGAIILSGDLKKINYANVLLTPDNRIKTSETGTRHKAAERTAKQAKTLAIAISERKNEMTLYYKGIRYPLVDTEDLLRKTSERLQLLEKQRELFDKSSEKLTKMDLKSYFNLNQAIPVIQKGRLIQKITSDLKRYSAELGKEGTLLRIRLKEIISGVEKETELILRDYAKNFAQAKLILNELSYDEILDENIICQILGYENPNINEESIPGWHLLMKTSIGEQEAEILIDEIKTWKKILESNIEELSKILGDERANTLKDDIKKMNLSYNIEK